MAQTHASFWKRHRWLMWLGIAALVVFIALTTAVAIIAHRFEPFLRARIVQGLEDRFRTHVELDSFKIAMGNGLHGKWGVWATGRGLRIWPPQPSDQGPPLDTAVSSAPLIQMQEFSFHIPFGLDARAWMHISQMRMRGISIHVPPRSERVKMTPSKPTAGKSGDQSDTPTPPPDSDLQSAKSPAPQPTGGVLSSVVIDRIDCDNAQLILETDKPNKLPLGFEIAHMRLMHVTSDSSVGFEANLTNPKPQGLVHAKGNFGPWVTSDPGLSPIDGDYQFEHADLGSFKGIAGILSSEGHFEGVLRDMVVQGKADVPDFRLTHFGHPMALQTQFNARVDGTDGDTWLNSVDATLGRSHFSTAGSIVRLKAPVGAVGPLPRSESDQAGLFEGGHMIDLKVNVAHGYVEDFLHLAAKSETPLLTGNIGVKAQLHIPPGHEPIHERIKIDGTFIMDNVHFTSEKIQSRIGDLSLRGQGKPGEVKKTDASTISSQMQGSFHMANSAIQLPDLQYNVPGAAITLNGHYDLDGQLDFAGAARMQATVSQMVGGWKGFLLKPADHFFKKGGAGTLIPIKIKGTRENPDFGVDLGALKSSSPQKPGEKK